MKNTKLYFSSLPFILLFIFSCTSKIEKSLDFTDVDRLMEQAVADSVFPGQLYYLELINKFFTARDLVILHTIKILRKQKQIPFLI
ncbi:MAG: hypothetical protein H6613_07055 [Ignavibacteriales bacterium]|nr:hypothetical protein [Ignavibacteriales bacterium]